MKYPILCASLVAVSLATSSFASTILSSQTFDDAASIDSWSPVATATASDKAWLSTGGNPGGAIEFSGTNATTDGAAYIFNYSQAVNFGGVSDVTITFDAIISQPLVGAAIHFSANEMGVATSNSFTDFNIENDINSSTYTTLTYEITGVPANADTLFLSFQVAAGAFVGAGGGISVDNIQVTAVPEPSALAGVLGLLSLAVVLRRRRS